MKMYKYIQLLSALTLALATTISVTTTQIFALDGVDQNTLDMLNPLLIGGEEMAVEGGVTNPEQFTTLGGIINRAILFIFPLSTAILFVMLLWGGFEMFSGSANKSSLESGKKRATMAVAGFLLLFVSFWLIQLIEAIFGIRILNMTT
jgi:hypothetical protein